MSPRRLAALAVAAALALGGCSLSRSAAVASRPDSSVPPPIPIEVVRPAGPGPFPAVVWLHGCSGLRRGSRHAGDWTRRLVAMGYAVALPDSFATRGYPDGVCGHGLRVSPETRAEDAYAAVRYLESQPDIAADRIALIGHSHGGWTVLAVVDRDTGARARAAAGARHGFAAAVAYYPECAYGSWVRAFQAAAPLLILAGELDDWTPAAPCRALAERAAAQGQPVSITVYPGALHAFDGFLPLTRVPEARRGRGATIGGNAPARADSIDRTREFLARHLAPAQSPPPNFPPRPSM